jgi:hypothetical protein
VSPSGFHHGFWFRPLLKAQRTNSPKTKRDAFLKNVYRKTTKTDRGVA